MKPNITFYDAHKVDQEFFRKTLGDAYELTFCEDPLSPATAHEAREAEIIAVHVTSQVSAAAMKLMPNLKHVACRTTGFDNVDLGYTRANKITVSTVPSYGEDTVAEYAFLLLLAASRRLMLSAHSAHFGKVSPEKLTGHDLNRKTLGIIGTGRIGRCAAKIGRGFGMTVVAYDLYPQQDAAKEIGFKYVSLNELLASSDCISLHAPATPETHHILDTAAFAKVKPGVHIVNTARGSLINTPALIEALESGRVAAAGLDVLEGEEYLHQDSKGTINNEQAEAVMSIDILSKMPNVLITSHNAYNSAEALNRIRETTVTNIKACQVGEPANVVK